MTASTKPSYQSQEDLTAESVRYQEDLSNWDTEQLTRSLEHVSDIRLHMRDCIRGLTIPETESINTCFTYLGQAMDRLQAEVDRRHAQERHNILLEHLSVSGGAVEILRVLTFLRDQPGQRTQAIQELRARTNWPLLDAKDFVDHILEVRGPLVSQAASTSRCQVCGAYPELA